MRTVELPNPSRRLIGNHVSAHNKRNLPCEFSQSRQQPDYPQDMVLTFR
jgi:hypothetical protein